MNVWIAATMLILAAIYSDFSYTQVSGPPEKPVRYADTIHLRTKWLHVVEAVPSQPQNTDLAIRLPVSMHLSNDSEIFVDDGYRTSARSIRDGRRSWTSRNEIGGPFASSDNALYAIDRQRLRFVRISAKAGKQTWESFKIDAFSRPDFYNSGRLFVHFSDIALIASTITFVNEKTNGIRHNQPEGTGLLFDPSTARLAGSNLIVKQTVDGGPAYTSIAAYNLSTGQRSWESAPAIDFGLHADAVIIRVDNASSAVL